VTLRLSAIVPATDEPPHLERVVAAIHAAVDGPDDVIVVRDAPQPGPAAARNAGAARATGDVLVFVDADVLPRADAFRRITTAFRDEPELAAVFGSYDDSPPEPDVVSGFRNLLHHHVHQESRGEASTFWAGLGAVRRDDFFAVGGFDAERYTTASIEDIELGMRLAGSGARMRLDPELQGTHLKRWTLRTMTRTDLRARGVPWVALLAERKAVPRGLNLGWRHRLSAAASLALVAFAVTGRPKPAGAAVGALVVLNARFYALLLRRRGPVHALAGVGLHALHHLIGAAAVPLGLLEHARERR